eukprot:2756537-Rhodomonas_salina.2
MQEPDPPTGSAVPGVTPSTQLRENLEQSLKGLSSDSPSDYLMAGISVSYAFRLCLDSDVETNAGVSTMDGLSSGDQGAQPMDVSGESVQDPGGWDGWGAPPANIDALEVLKNRDIARMAPSADPITPPSDTMPVRQLSIGERVHGH